MRSYISEADGERSETFGKRSNETKFLQNEVATHDSFHTEITLKEFVIDLNEDKQKLKQLGYDWIHIDLDASFLISYDRYAYAAPIVVQKKEDASIEHGWITLEFADNGKTFYKDSISGQILQNIESPQSVDARSWLEDISRNTKVVKSRTGIKILNRLNML